MRAALFMAATLLALATVQADAESRPGWDGTWTGVVPKTGETVSVTIAGNKVLSYSVRGASPFPILYSTVTARSVLFGDWKKFSVKIVKTGTRTAWGTAQSPMGVGSASLARQ